MNRSQGNDRRSTRNPRRMHGAGRLAAGLALAALASATAAGTASAAPAHTTASSVAPNTVSPADTWWGGAGTGS